MTSKNTYRLINPYIEGSVDTTVNSRNSFNGAKKLYKNISEYFTNHVKNFNMVIQNVNTDKLTHFKINEKNSKDGTVDYDLTILNNNFPLEIEKKLISSFNKLSKQSGGKSHRKYDDSDSSDSSSSSEDLYNQSIQPITRFVYFYLPYYQYEIYGATPLDLSRLYLPMFSLPVNPVYEVRFDYHIYRR